MPPERLEATRLAVADAKAAVTRSAAEAREAERRVRHSEHAVEVDKPQFVAARVAHHAGHREILTELPPVLAQLEALNNELHDNFSRAADEFPAFYPPFYGALRQGRETSRPYPVNAGLLNLAWPGVPGEPHAANGGRLGTFRKQVDEFLSTSDETLSGRTA